MDVGKWPDPVLETERSGKNLNDKLKEPFFIIFCHSCTLYCIVPCDELILNHKTETNYEKAI